MIKVKNASRINVLQLLECCIFIQTMPRNSIIAWWMSLWLKEYFGHSVESVKSFSKEPFFSSVFFYFVTNCPWNVKYQRFSTVFDIGSLMKTYGTMVLVFQYFHFCQVLLMNFYFLGTLLHIIQHFCYFWTNLFQITNRLSVSISEQLPIFLG